MYYPDVLKTVIWNPSASHWEYIFGNDGGMTRTLEGLSSGYKAIDWDTVEPDTVRKQAPKKGSDWVKDVLEAVSGGGATDKAVRALIKDLERTGKLAAAMRNKIGDQIVRHSKVLREASDTLSGIEREAPALAADMEKLLLVARKDILDILFVQEAVEISTGTGPAFEDAEAEDLGLLPSNECILVDEKIVFKKTKYLQCDPMTLKISVNFLSEKEPRHAGAITVTRMRLKHRIKELESTINDAIDHFNTTFTKNVEKGVYKDEREIRSLVDGANVMVRQAVLVFEKQMPGEIEDVLNKDKKLAGKLKKRKILAKVKAIGALVVATVAAAAAIAAGIAGAVASFGAATPLAIAAGVVGVIGVVATAAGVLGSAAHAYKAAQRNEKMAEKKLMSAFIDMKTHFNKLDQARKKGVRQTLTAQLFDLLDGYVSKCKKAKDEHWMQCQHMISGISDVQVKINDLEKKADDLSKTLAVKKKELDTVVAVDAKDEKRKKALEKEFANLTAFSAKLEKQIDELHGLRKLMEERLQAKVDLHEELAVVLKAAKDDRPVVLSKVDTAFAHASRAVEIAKPLIAAAKTIGKSAKGIFDAVKKIQA